MHGTRVAVALASVLVATLNGALASAEPPAIAALCPASLEGTTFSSEGNTRAPTETFPSLGGGSPFCLSFHAGGDDFDVARAFCRAHGGDLASVRAEAEAAAAAEWVEGVTAGAWGEWEVKIGLRDDVVEGVWYWDDGSATDFLPWVPGSPDNWSGAGAFGEDCATLTAAAQIEDVGCTGQHAFICRFDLQPAPTTCGETAVPTAAVQYIVAEKTFVTPVSQGGEPDYILGGVPHWVLPHWGTGRDLHVAADCDAGLNE